MKLIMERFEDTFVYSTFFYSKLLSHDCQAVHSWHKETDKMSKRLLIFPVHQEELAHWSLAAADVTSKQITYFDSLKNENLKCLRNLRNFLQEFCGQTYSTVLTRDIPMQSNSYDCGVFVCMYARCLAEKSDFNFSQQDTPTIRRHIVLELMCKTLF